MATTSAATPRAIPAIESSETDETSRDGRDRRYRTATSSGERLSLAVLSHRLEEPVEQDVRVVRARRRLRVELRGEDRQDPVAESLERSVVQVAVRRLDVRGQRPGVDREAVVLRRDRDVAGAEVLDRVVRAAMAELQLERASRRARGRGAGGRGRCRRSACPSGRAPRSSGSGPASAAGSPGPLERKMPSGRLARISPRRSRSPGRSRRGTTRPGAGARCCASSRSRWPRRGTSCGRVRRARGAPSAATPRAPGRCRASAARRARAGASSAGVVDLGRDAGAHRALAPDPAHEGARVEPVEARHAAGGEIVREALLSARAAPARREVPRDEAGDVDAVRLRLVAPDRRSCRCAPPSSRRSVRRTRDPSGPPGSRSSRC